MNKYDVFIVSGSLSIVGVRKGLGEYVNRHTETLSKYVFTSSVFRNKSNFCAVSKNGGGKYGNFIF